MFILIYISLITQIYQKELFLKWTTLPQTSETIKKLINDIKIKPQSILNQNLVPLLSSPKIHLQNSMLLNSTIKNPPFTPPKSPNDLSNFFLYMRTNALLFIKDKRKLNQTASDLLESPTNLSPRKFEFEVNHHDFIKTLKFFIKDKEKDDKLKIKKKEDNYQQIPQFYFPPGKSLDQNISDEVMVNFFYNIVKIN